MVCELWLLGGCGYRPTRRLRTDDNHHARPAVFVLTCLSCGCVICLRQMAPADAVRLLLVRGARVQAKGRRGMGAIDCAEGRHDILNVLAQVWYYITHTHTSSRIAGTDAQFAGVRTHADTSQT